MYRFLQVFLVIFLSSILFVSCKKKQDKKEVEANLKTAMGLFLNHDPHIDTSHVKFSVLEVSYYEAPKGYICDFKVNLKERKSDRMVDTTGIMTANVSKDFTTVSRRY